MHAKRRAERSEPFDEFGVGDGAPFGVVPLPEVLILRRL